MKQRELIFWFTWFYFTTIIVVVCVEVKRSNELAEIKRERDAAIWHKENTQDMIHQCLKLFERDGGGVETLLSAESITFYPHPKPPVIKPKNIAIR